MTDPFRSGFGGGLDLPAAPASARRYRLGALLGRGAMGEVYEAVDTVLGRTVALKVLAGDAPPGAAERLRREATLMAGLEHHGIVAVHDAAELDDGRPCYAMRLVRGATFTDAIRARRADGPAGVRALLTIAEAVAFAHAAGVLHRDIKPDNVLIGELGEALLSDWGVARRLDAPEGEAEAAHVASPQLTRLGARVGTPAWMA
ncbi:MAG TPA: serine/threonine-protein kinase, partial [Myxococcota bacterium]|nr:serine/threonine-protein kinase [Myxococcota bacterium]